MVGHEAEATGPPGQVVDADQGVVRGAHLGIGRDTATGSAVAANIAAQPVTDPAFPGGAPPREAVSAALPAPARVTSPVVVLELGAACVPYAGVLCGPADVIRRTLCALRLSRRLRRPAVAARPRAPSRHRRTSPP
ncbi:hypothetical protein ACIBAG_30330 [Streptomyces sp. NPDC051243]|uniref:hypothetical protein n=1 Tax=Streptomyces sp. NPDC051243 TaxID=3365646 RepID=UPI003788F2E1